MVVILLFALNGGEAMLAAHGGVRSVIGAFYPTALEVPARTTRSVTII